MAVTAAGLTTTWTAGTDAEDALLEGGRLAAAGGLARRLVHDLANPLVGILGVTELLLADADAGTAAHRELALVRDSAEELRALLARFGRFASGPGGGGLVRLDDVAREAVAVVRASGDADEVDVLEQHADTGLVLGDPRDLLLAAFALVANGTRAATRGGIVGVTTARESGVASLTVVDDGAGLDASTAARAFDPFFSTWGRPGLGLPSARAAARRSGGDVVQLRRATGAAFRLTAPCAEDA